MPHHDHLPHTYPFKTSLVYIFYVCSYHLCDHGYKTSLLDSVLVPGACSWSKLFFFFTLLYNTVLVLPYIDMNPPRVYMSSQSWTPLPPPTPYHLSGSSPCTSPRSKHFKLIFFASKATLTCKSDFGSPLCCRQMPSGAGQGKAECTSICYLFQPQRLLSVAFPSFRTFFF